MRPTHNKPKTADVQRTVAEKKTAYERANAKAIKNLQQARASHKTAAK